MHPPPSASINENRNPITASRGRENPTEQETQGAVAQVRNRFIGFTGVTKSVIVHPIVPVKVKTRGCVDFLVTYPFLDGGSNSTFCTEELLKYLCHGWRILKKMAIFFKFAVRNPF